MPHATALIQDEEHQRETIQALTTLALCHHSQVVALVAAVEAMLAVMCKSEPGHARQLAAHLAVSAEDHQDEDWQHDQRMAFDNQVKRLQTLLLLLQKSSA